MNDLENDPNLALALDKIENDFKTTVVTKTKTDHQKNTGGLAGPDLKTKLFANRKAVLKADAVSKHTFLNAGTYSLNVKPDECNQDSGTGNVARHLTPGKPPVVSGENVINSFSDLLFASPIDVSTPQIFKSTRPASKQTVDSRAEETLQPATKSSETCAKADKTPQSTPRRSTRLSARKKRVLEGLELTKNDLKENRNNKSDFFKSLLAGNDTLEDISDLTHEGHSRNINETGTRTNSTGKVINCRAKKNPFEKTTDPEKRHEDSRSGVATKPTDDVLNDNNEGDTSVVSCVNTSQRIQLCK